MRLEKSIKEAIPISVIILLFGSMLLDGGLWSGPLILTNSVWIVFLTYKLLTIKGKDITSQERTLILLSPIYVSLIGAVVSNIARSIK